MFYAEDCEAKCHGVKGSSVLSKLRHYCPLKNTIIDFMHSVLEGVLKKFFKIWFSDTLSTEEGSLKGYIEQINERVLKVRPPSFVPAALRDISLWKMWRAKEFLFFLFIIHYPFCLSWVHEPRKVFALN